MKLNSWPEIGSDGDVLLMPYVPKGITGYDDDELCNFISCVSNLSFITLYISGSGIICRILC